MFPETIMQQASAQGVRLYVEEGKLKYIAKLNKFPPHLKAVIKQNKDQIIAFIEAQQSSKQSLIPRAERQDWMTLSFAQLRILFIDRMYQGSSHYNMVSTLEISGDVCARSMRQSVDQLVQRHEILRTRYAERRGEWFQCRVAANEQSCFHEFDLSALTDQQRDEVLQKESSYQFDLLTENPLRICLFKQAAQHYVLYFNVHHIACDGVSLEVLTREVQALYHAALNNTVAQLPEQTIAYCDFSVWQRQTFAQDGFNAGLAYWKDTLLNAPAVHELPLQGKRPQTQDFKGRAVRLEISNERLAKLRAFNKQCHATLYMTLETLFAALICRLSGSGEIVIGTPVAGRGYAELEQVVGLFLNNIVVRTALKKEDSFNTLLRRNKDVILQAYEHQDVPFDLIVEQVNPVRDSGIAPVFQILFNLIRQNTTLNFANTAISNASQENVTVKSDLELVAIEKDDSISLSFVYDVNLFSETFINMMANSFLNLMDSAIANPNSEVNRLPLVTFNDDATNSTHDNYRHNASYNALDVNYVAREAQCIAALITPHVQTNPQQEALRQGEYSLNYAQLMQQVTQAVQQFAAHGLSSGNNVGLFMPRAPTTVIAMLALLRLGVTFVPLATNLPEKRLGYIIDDAQLDVILVVNDEALIELSETHPVVTRAVSVATLFAASPANESPILQVGTGNSIAYVMYTSGTSGKPKGVQVTQGNLASFFGAMAHDLPLSAEMRWLSITNISFDISMLELLGSLSMGMTLVFPDTVGDALQSPATIARAIIEQKVTTLQCTPSLFSALLKDTQFETALPKIQTILLGGEAFDIAILRYFAQRPLELGHIRLFNMYGPTETTIWSTCSEVTPPSDNQEAPPRVSIGKPLSNTQVSILDNYYQPVPQGVVGELAIGGDGVSQGYLRQPELTDEKFITDVRQLTATSHRCATNRFYLTGDLVRLLDDGSLDFMGRRDEQIKIRGHRIELAEIEVALVSALSVDSATVLLRETAHQGAEVDSQLVAYIAVQSGTILTQKVNVNDVLEPAWVTQVLKPWLPDYMIPSAVVCLSILPLNANGKVDKPALRLLSVDATHQRTPPDTAMEQTLVLFWKEVLQNDSLEVFKESDFFSLGGNSLHLMQLASIIKNEMAVSIPLILFIDNRTLRELSVAVQAHIKQSHSNNDFAPQSEAVAANESVEVEI